MKGPTTIVKMDLFADLLGIARAQLLAQGYAIPASLGTWPTLFAWFDIGRRVPARRPRRVHRSKELRCPAHHLAGLAQLTGEFTRGEDLRPRVSRKLFSPNLLSKVDPHDRLLNDWGIHHFHLGPITNGVASGNAEVLYAIVETDDVYMIDVLGHTFSDITLVQIVDANWPELLSELAVCSSQKAFTSAEVTLARRAGAQTFVQIGERVIWSRGGGYATSGHSIASMMKAREWANATDQWERMIREALPDILSFARSKGIRVPDALTFRLLRDQRGFLAVEEAIMVEVPLPDWYGPQARTGGQPNV